MSDLFFGKISLLCSIIRLIRKTYRLQFYIAQDESHCILETEKSMPLSLVAAAEAASAAKTIDAKILSRDLVPLASAGLELSLGILLKAAKSGGRTSWDNGRMGFQSQGPTWYDVFLRSWSSDIAISYRNWYASLFYNFVKPGQGHHHFLSMPYLEGCTLHSS